MVSGLRSGQAAAVAGRGGRCGDASALERHPARRRDVPVRCGRPVNAYLPSALGPTRSLRLAVHRGRRCLRRSALNGAENCRTEVLTCEGVAHAAASSPALMVMQHWSAAARQVGQHAPDSLPPPEQALVGAS